MDVKVLKSLSFFDDFTLPDMERASRFLMEKKYDRNSFIFMEGDSGHELFIVVSGTVEINRFEYGKKFVISTLQKGDIFGEMSLFDEGEFRSANAKVVDKAVLASIERRHLQSLLETSPGITNKLLTILIHRLRKANDRIHDVAFLNVRERIYKQLLRLVEEHGVKLNHMIMINLRLTHQQIADMVGCTREMVSKVLSELQVDHIIGINKKRITVKNKLLLSDKVSGY
jgi:CRP/FNR family transcriptional regulator